MLPPSDTDGPDTGMAFSQLWFIDCWIRVDVSSQTEAVLRWSVGVEMVLRVAVIRSALQAGTHNSSACTTSNDTPVDHRRAT